MLRTRRTGEAFWAVLSVLAVTTCATLVAVLMTGRGRDTEPSELKSFDTADWNYVPEGPLPEDYVGELAADGNIRPAKCSTICNYCFQGALKGWTYPGASMASDACGICNCEAASNQLPEFDTWNREGRCSAELCMACGMGRLTGKPCQSCECGEWRNKRTLKDICPNQKSICYSCMSGTLQGRSCSRCQCGSWDDWTRKASEDRFSAHDCTSVCHSCNIGAIVDGRCDLCICAQSLDPEHQVDGRVLSHHVPDLEAAANAFKGSVEQESAVHKQVAGRPRALRVLVSIYSHRFRPPRASLQLADMLD
jgi:hypothetical protein